MLLAKFVDRELGMQGVTIRDIEHPERGGFLCFDLKDILSAIGDAAVVSRWRCRNVECVGQNAEKLYELSETGKNVSGLELSEIMDGIFQTIDGQFEAFLEGGEEPWLVVDAVDSSWFDVFSEDASVLQRIRNSFRDVRPIPPTAT
jgi:hypothetical protein